MRNQWNMMLMHLTWIMILLLGLSGQALAVDGVIEINQARALVGGVTPGDTPGFPVTIDTSWSYRLTGNLTPGGNVDGIFIIAENVTIDLNGFSIIGPGTGNGRGIFAQQMPDAGRSNVNVMNGSVSDMGGNGVQLLVAASVKNVTATHNGGNGITALGGSTVTSSTANQNSGNGIQVVDGSLVISSVANRNGGNGISAGERAAITNNSANFNNANGIAAANDALISGNSANGNSADGINAGQRSNVNGNTANSNGGDGIMAGAHSAVVGNMASANTSFGLRLPGMGTGYANNVLAGNSGTVTGGVQMGINICNSNTACP